MKNLNLTIFFVLGLLFCTNGVSAFPQVLKSGPWKGEFLLEKGKTIPFMFSISSDAKGETYATLINGSEKVKLEKTVYKSDSVIIPIIDYNAVLVGEIKGDSLIGFYRKADSFLSHLPFRAVYGDSQRFSLNGVSPVNLSGRWDLSFEGDDSEKGDIAVFSEKNNIVTGSILTNTGDYRYSEGVIDAGGFRLSSFYGTTPYLIEGRFSDDNHFEGEFTSPRGTRIIKGVRNDRAELADAYGLTKLKPGYKTLNFRLPDLNGKYVSLKDPEYRGKVVIVSILGSWCPNCRDEMAFLAPWYKKNKGRGVEVLGISFEIKNDIDYAKRVLSVMKNHYGADYDILFAGKVDAATKAKALPEIESLESFPTIFFIGKDGSIKKIHTGYTGPATGVFYENFKKEFEEIVDKLLAE